MGPNRTPIITLFDRMLAQPKPSADIAEFRAAYMNIKKMPMDTVDPLTARCSGSLPTVVSRASNLFRIYGKRKTTTRLSACLMLPTDYNPEEMVFYSFGGLALYEA